MNGINHYICTVFSWPWQQILHSQLFKIILFFILLMIVVIIIIVVKFLLSKREKWFHLILCTLTCDIWHVQMSSVLHKYWLCIQIATHNRPDKIGLYNLKHLIWHLHQAKVQDVWGGWGGGASGDLRSPLVVNLPRKQSWKSADCDSTATPSGEKS